MRNKLLILAAGIITLLSFNSCSELNGTFDEKSCDASLTCYYAGGIPSASSPIKKYELDGPLTDKEIEEIFFELSATVQPGFSEATLELKYYNWMGKYDYTDVYDFRWVTENHINGDGYYDWDERL